MDENSPGALPAGTRVFIKVSVKTDEGEQNAGLLAAPTGCAEGDKKSGTRKRLKLSYAFSISHVPTPVSAGFKK